MVFLHPLPLSWCLQNFTTKSVFCQYKNEVVKIIFLVKLPNDIRDLGEVSNCGKCCKIM